jgi:hypothetical protein
MHYAFLSAASAKEETLKEAAQGYVGSWVCKWHRDYPLKTLYIPTSIA